MPPTALPARPAPPRTAFRFPPLHSQGHTVRRRSSLGALWLGGPRRGASRAAAVANRRSLRAAFPCCSAVRLASGQPSTEPNPPLRGPKPTQLAGQPQWKRDGWASAPVGVGARYELPAAETEACKVVQRATQRAPARYGTIKSSRKLAVYHRNDCLGLLRPPKSTELGLSALVSFFRRLLLISPPTRFLCRACHGRFAS